ncbi:3-hydroxybutyrate dehydrogenase [Aquidulcibacter sp.]|uniref:3-hydroxybutyrate dehydrogenase n=1 Tax=Aquidulcibacter sp. TaxID=2052990 RepID=UPI0025C05388|nr:3-hydroxybutyrate dehydrogenase [Aquidulcibacter sp.]MCA3692178.1 3-hydroxybutyrate dehydrogenase [Aquidulcibacter sp.]
MTTAAKVALITGSTSGIGLAIAEAFAAAGYGIMINGLGDADQIEATRTRIAADHKVDVLYHPANMLVPAEIEDMVTKTRTHFGRLDVLVNNAGIQFVAPIEEFPAEKWDQIIGINLSSAFHTIRHAIPGMAAQKWGRIINIASAHGLVASPFKSAYVAAKHGIVGLTKTVALEHAKEGVTCNAICPGYVLTGLVKAQIPDQARSRGITEEEVIQNVLLAAQPTKQFVTVEQVASFALYLASDSAAQINGAILTMDGGWTAQ